MKRSDFRRSDRYIVLDNDRCGHCMVSDHVTNRNCCRQFFYVQKYGCIAERYEVCSKLYRNF